MFTGGFAGIGKLPALFGWYIRYGIGIKVGLTTLQHTPLILHKYYISTYRSLYRVFVQYWLLRITEKIPTNDTEPKYQFEMQLYLILLEVYLLKPGTPYLLSPVCLSPPLKRWGGCGPCNGKRLKNRLKRLPERNRALTPTRKSLTSTPSKHRLTFAREKISKT